MKLTYEDKLGIYKLRKEVSAYNFPEPLLPAIARDVNLLKFRVRFFIIGRISFSCFFENSSKSEMMRRSETPFSTERRDHAEREYHLYQAP